MAYNELSIDLTAEDLIRLRYAALQEQDFSLLYASYHPCSPFIEQFPDVAAYLEFAAQNLIGTRLRGLKLGESRRVHDDGIEQICGLTFSLGAERQILYELALLLPIQEGWRYHSSQKLTEEEYQGEFDALDFVHFDRQSPKIRY